MSIEAELPDGTILEFPDGTDEAVIQQVVRQQLGVAEAEAPAQPAATASVEAPGAAPAPPERERDLVSDITGFMANVNRGLGIGDELAAAAATAGDIVTGKAALPGVVDAFKGNMLKQRQIEDEYRADRPKTAALALGTGNALTMAAPTGPGAAAFTTGGKAINALRGATVAGLSGAAYGAVDRGTLEERAGAAATAARDPVTLGLGAAVGSLAGHRPRAERAPAPTVDDLRAQKDAAYKAVDESGVGYSAEQFKELTSEIIAEVGAARFNAKLHPKAAAMLDYVSDLANQAVGTAPTLSELDDLRKVIGRDVASSPDAGERRMGQIMRNKIDDFIESMGEGSDDLLRARELNTRVKKLEALDQLDEAAIDRASTGGTGSNIDNTTRQNVRRFQDKTNNLTTSEQAAAQRVIRGTPGQNALRAVGRLSPEGGTVSAIGSLVTGPISGGTLPAAGFVARRVADAITKRNVEELRRIIATGDEGAQEVVKQLQVSGADDLLPQLANDLSVVAGVEGAAARAPIEIDVSRSTNPAHLEWRRAQGLQ